MHGEEDHQPNPGPCLDAQAKSPEILTLETSAPLTLAPPDHGPQKAQVFQEFMQIDVDADSQFHTPNSPQASSQEAVADVTQPSASIFRPGFKGKKHGHDDLLRRLGLWDFVHMSFDRALRADLIVQLLSTFKKKDSGQQSGFG
ncbi:hypothetical protein SAY87_011692 [Trapa incisa]|uniref:Uncharacterized protein n=1 Tax=Trapa incisa TaxID=236973 RepID=A0AAN7GLI5_9MYRT|nr:hypothetical protein SAY87_011692 [Trapa incisa]